jgi:uncharacterized protein YjiK
VSRAALLVAVLLAGCGPSKEERARADSAAAVARGERIATLLADSAGRTDTPLAKWILPDDMAEISGIVLTPDGNHVIAHADEQAHLVAINFRTGVITKRFDLGERTVIGDFEGITRVGLDYFMMTSKAQIYQFREAEHEGRADYSVLDTKLAGECEFEGIAHDPLTNSFLLACKRPQKAMRDSMIVYRWPRGPNPEPVSRIAVPLDQVIGSNDWDDIHPSDITVDPFTGNYVIVARQEDALIVITRDGQVVRSGTVPTGLRGAEGLAITEDGLLLVSAEAESKQLPANVTLFRWRP